MLNEEGKDVLLRNLKQKIREYEMLPLIFSFSTRELVKTLVKTRIPLDQRILDSLVIRLWVVLRSGSTPAAWLLPLHVQCFIPILLNIAYMRDGLYIFIYLQALCHALLRYA
jgi:hypothetical protein